MPGRTSQEWFRLIAEYQSCKETVNVFCRRNQISDSAFYYWLNKSKQKDLAPIKMVPVVAAEEPSIDIVELLMPKGMSLRFSPGASTRYVADIVKGLL